MRKDRLLQLTCLVASVACALIYFGTTTRATATDEAGRKPSAAAVSRSFRPTEGQWQAFKVDVVRRVRFDVVAQIDAHLAADDTRTIPVLSQYSGRITSVSATVGQAVARGEPLAQMLASESAQARSDLASALASLDSATRQLEQAQRNEKRTHALFEAQAAAQKDVDQSETDLAVARANLESARATAAAARARSAILDSSAMPGQPGETAYVRAPISGTVIQRGVQAGQYVSSVNSGGSSALFTVSDLRHLWVLGTVAAVPGRSIRVGQPVRVTLQDDPSRMIESKISWVGQSLDPQTHRIPVRVDIENASGDLRPETLVQMQILEQDAKYSVALPRAAIVSDGEGAHCYVATPDHVIRPRQIEIGRSANGLVEVTKGLLPGELVVTEGPLFLDVATASPEHS